MLKYSDINSDTLANLLRDGLDATCLSAWTIAVKKKFYKGNQITKKKKRAGGNILYLIMVAIFVIPCCLDGTYIYEPARADAQAPVVVGNGVYPVPQTNQRALVLFLLTVPKGDFYLEERLPLLLQSDVFNHYDVSVVATPSAASHFKLQGTIPRLTIVTTDDELARAVAVVGEEPQQIQRFLIVLAARQNDVAMLAEDGSLIPIPDFSERVIKPIAAISSQLIAVLDYPGSEDDIIASKGRLFYGLTGKSGVSDGVLSAAYITGAWGFAHLQQPGFYRFDDGRTANHDALVTAHELSIYLDLAVAARQCQRLMRYYHDRCAHGESLDPETQQVLAKNDFSIFKASNWGQSHLRRVVVSDRLETDTPLYLAADGLEQFPLYVDQLRIQQQLCQDPNRPLQLVFDCWQTRH